MKFYVPIIAALLLVTSCKKEQPFIGETKDICECLKEKRSSFFMGERFGEQNIDLDTIVMPVFYADGNPANFDSINDVYIEFEAPYEDALSYEWWVGSDPTPKTERSFGLYFDDTMTIAVTLIMTSPINEQCIPGDDGMDTISRVLSIKNVSPHPMWGSYYGYDLEDPNNPYTIEIDTMTQYFSFLTPPYACREVIKNLPEGKINPIFFVRDFGYTTRSFLGTGFQSAPYNDIIYVGDKPTGLFEDQTRGIYDPETNQITITYFTRDIISPTQLSEEYTRHVFVGTKQ
jgi:hypothetical protein